MSHRLQITCEDFNLNTHIQGHLGMFGQYSKHPNRNSTMQYAYKNSSNTSRLRRSLTGGLALVNFESVQDCHSKWRQILLTTYLPASVCWSEQICHTAIPCGGVECKALIKYLQVHETVKSVSVAIIIGSLRSPQCSRRAFL